jgi:adenosylcobinamide-GDP ribazoletransferase
MSENSDLKRGGASWAEPLKAVTVDLAQCLRFYSRIPVPALPWEAEPHALPDFRRIARVLPLAGLTIGVLPAAALALAHGLGLGPWLAAALSIATMTLTTGAFHEDGLADTADGFGGGATPERRLAIMKDSLIGSFGGSALVLAFTLRIAALTTLADRVAIGPAMLGVLAAAALSRTVPLVMLVSLPPARRDGVAYAVAQPSRETLGFALTLAAVLTVALGALAGFALINIALMLVLSALAAWGLTSLSKRLIGGHSGDVAGAIQQVAEIGAMIGLLIVLEP